MKVSSKVFPFDSADLFFEDSTDLLQYKKGQVIYCEGSTPLGIYFIKKGKVKITRIGSDNKVQILHIARGGELVQCPDMISGSRYTTSAKTLEDSTLLFLPTQQLTQLLENNEEFCRQILALTSEWLRMANTRMTDLAYKPVRGRLADALVYLAEIYEETSGENPSISLSRSDIASYIGTAKETVNRLISEFREEGLIENDRSNIYVLDKEKLIHTAKMYD